MNIFSFLVSYGDKNSGNITSSNSFTGGIVGEKGSSADIMIIDNYYRDSEEQVVGNNISYSFVSKISQSEFIVD